MVGRMDDDDVPLRAARRSRPRHVHQDGRISFSLALVDLFLTSVFAVLPDSRLTDATGVSLIFSTQAVLAWLNVTLSLLSTFFVYTTYSVYATQLTWERKQRMWYVRRCALVKLVRAPHVSAETGHLPTQPAHHPASARYVVALKPLQILLDVSVSAYPTLVRQSIAISCLGIRATQVASHTRKTQPPHKDHITTPQPPHNRPTGCLEPPRPSAREAAADEAGAASAGD